MNWNISFSNYDRVLEEFYTKNDPEFMPLREKIRQILQQEDELAEIVQLVGRDSLSEDQKAILKTAQIIKEEFLQQNSFSQNDYNCPMHKTMGMMKCIVKFHESCLKILEDTAKSDKKVSMGLIESSLKTEVVEKLQQMKF